MLEASSQPVSGYNERLILMVLATVQFITIVDFMIVMPLGPQLMRVLQISPAAFGLVVSSYTFAAGAAGWVASATVDRFDRRKTFLVLYAGFILGTLMCGLAPNYASLVVAAITRMPSQQLGLAIAVFGAVMVCNVGRMIPAMAMVTSCVAAKHRGAFLSANSSVQHLFGGVGAYVGGLIVSQAADGTALEGFGIVGWISAILAMTSFWLAGRLRSSEQAADALPSSELSATELALPASAEAAFKAGEAFAKPACVTIE